MAVVNDYKNATLDICISGILKSYPNMYFQKLIYLSENKFSESSKHSRISISWFWEFYNMGKIKIYKRLMGFTESKSKTGPSIEFPIF